MEIWQLEFWHYTSLIIFFIDYPCNPNWACPITQHHISFIRPDHCIPFPFCAFCQCILFSSKTLQTNVYEIFGWIYLPILANGILAMDIRYFSIYFLISFFYLQSRKLLSKFLLRIYLDFPECYLLSNDSISQMMIILTWTRTFVFPTMPYSLIMIVAMLTYQSACGCVCQSVWECLTICFFIISYSNIVINTQTFRYLVGYLPVKSTKELLEN